MAVMRYWAVTASPWSVSTVQRSRRLVPVGGRHAGLELDVAAEVEAVGDVVEVAQDLRLLGVLAAPLPLLHQVLVERVAVDVRLGVAAGARVAVPVPGAADVVAGFEHPRQAHLVAQRQFMYIPAKPAPITTASQSNDSGELVI